MSIRTRQEFVEALEQQIEFEKREMEKHRR